MLHRRHFLATVAGAVAGFHILPRRVLAGDQQSPPSERLNIAGIGVGGQGGAVVRQLAELGQNVVALCDVDGKYAANTFKTYPKAEIFQDYRVLLDKRRDVDAVVIGTPDHMHAPVTVAALRAGKHVYVEKPLAHYIWEGRQMVNAARKYNRLVQIGTQARSRDTDRQVIEYIRSGQLGKIQYIVCFANKGRASIGKRSEPLPIPETLDYDLWCGPARKEPIYRNRVQYDCSFTWNMGDGESCNQGVHEVDVARWLLGETTLPRRVMSIGGRFTFNDAGDVPNTQLMYYDYPSAPILYEVHNLRAGKDSKSMPSFRGHGVDTCVQCEGGYAMMHAGLVCDNQGKELKRFSGKEDPFGNFIGALRSGKREDLNAEVLEGHLSTNICHAGNISYRLGQRASAADVRAQIGDLPVFQEMVDRYLEHIKAHDIDPGESILGPWLECDTDQECFKDNVRANELVKGFYRKPFEVPQVTL